jgi:hypothetical protein
MKYRKYKSLIKLGATSIIALGVITSCASTGDRSPDSEMDRETRREMIDGREPASMRGDFTWLNEVEDDFGRIADETSSRAVASQNKQEVLMKRKDWAFSYLPKTNHFYVNLQGVAYKMIQTNINDGERFAFAAEGQPENPLTFSVAKGEGRKVASGTNCVTEISYWNKRSKSYVTDKIDVAGKECERVLSLLKDYVP